MEHMTMRDTFFNELFLIAKKDRNVILITADIGAPSLDKFRKDLGKQFINVGIAEQNMVTLAAGLSLSGKKVYIYAIMPFVTLRCYEMIKVNLSLMNLPVTAIGAGAGFSYDESGPTHHSIEDLAIMRILPHMTILSASDSVMASKFAWLSYTIPGPSFVRLDRRVLPIIYSDEEEFESGLKKIRGGTDIVIIATGNMVHRAIEISDFLSQHGLKAGVVDLYRIKPLNYDLLMSEIQDTKRLITLEEHLLMGGLGSIIAEFLADYAMPTSLKRFGIHDKYYYAYGGRENIQRLCGLNSDNLINEILSWVR